MANPPQLLSLQPFSTTQVGRNPEEIPIQPDDVLQLATDMINVEEGRVALSSFPLAYQEKIKAFYQFSATRYTTDQTKIAKRTPDTLDIV